MEVIKYNNEILWGKIKEWPSIPEHLLTDLSNYNDDEIQWEGKGLRVATKDNQSYKNSLYKRWPLSTNLETWIKENINCNFNQIGLQKIDPVNEERKLLVHCDKEPRRWTILYIVDLGGDNIYTHFYKEKNKPLVRNFAEVTNQLDDLEQLASAKFESNSWVLLNGLILHDVDPISRPRIAITGSIWSEDPCEDLKISL
jgi:hypothetical protein